MGKTALLLAGKPVEIPSALRYVDEPFGCELRAERLMSSRSGTKGLQVERPVASLSFADSLRECRDFMSGLKPWLSAVGVKPFIL